MQMLEKHKAQKAIKEHQEALARWQSQRDGYAHLLEVAQGFNGEATDEVMLKAGEALFYKVTSCSLVEERRGAGHYQGGSTGVSIPIGSIGGRSVRYRVGANRGHYVQGAPVPTAIDTGTVFITNQRVIFAGNKQTRECLYAKTISISHDDSAGETTISVSNRQKPTVLHYGAALSGSFDFRLELAIAHFNGTLPQLIDNLTTQLSQIEAERPPDLETPLAAPPAAPSPPAASDVQAPASPPQAEPPVSIPPPVTSPEDHEAFWEYQYFATELAQGLADLQPSYLEYQGQVAGQPGLPVGDPPTNLHWFSDELSKIVARVEVVLAPSNLEKAFGAPGMSGDEVAIRSAAADLCTIYSDLITWGLRVRGASVEAKWKPVYAALSQFASLPLHQLQDFSAVVSANVTRIVADVRAQKPTDEHLVLTLQVSIDPNAESAFQAAFAEAKSTL
jgi:hypothetical protein